MNISKVHGWQGSPNTISVRGLTTVAVHRRQQLIWGSN